MSEGEARADIVVAGAHEAAEDRRIAGLMREPRNRRVLIRRAEVTEALVAEVERQSLVSKAHTEQRLSAIEARLDAIEARQRTGEHHDPACLKWQTMVAQRSTGAYLLPHPCTCWLQEGQ